MHKAFVPQLPGTSHGFLHFELIQAAASGQSEFVKQTSGSLQPVLIGSPTKLPGQVHVKLPG